MLKKKSCRVVALVIGCAVAAPASAWAAPVGVVTESTPTAISPFGIASGPDGNLWFTSIEGNSIGRITPDGVLTEFGAGLSANSQPREIVTGPDGNLWFTELAGDRIGRITPEGTITEFGAGITPTSQPSGIATGPDGNLWFTETAAARIGRITLAGVVTEFPVTAGSRPTGITAGPDGNLWFAMPQTGRIGRISPAGVVTEFNAGIDPSGGPLAIAAGPDGNVWFTEVSAGRIARITPNGTVTEFPVGGNPGAIAPGPDGQMWFTEFGGRIGRISSTGTVATFRSSAVNTSPAQITAGPDGNLWSPDVNRNRILRIGAGAPAPSLAAPAVTGTGELGTQQLCQGDRWATWAGEQPLADAFGFDGYAWTIDGEPIPDARTRSYTPTERYRGGALRCSLTVTYPLTEVTVTATSEPLTVVDRPAGPAGTAGTNGQTGATGMTGPQGPAAQPGRDGAAGAPGVDGSPGTQGPAGDVGPVGSPGATGPAGRDANATCTPGRTTRNARTRKLQVKVLCTVRLAVVARATLRLSRDGRTIATGRARRSGALTLQSGRRVAAGRYVLTITAAGATTRLPVRIR